jgi:hypothetical protein
MPDLIVSKQLFYFWITIPYAEHLILFIRQIWPLRLLTFRVSEKYMKWVLQGSSFDEPDELLFVLQKIEGVDRETLDAAFQK